MSTSVPASHIDLLDAKTVGHLATIGPDGAPQSTPIWFLWNGESLQISITKARQKYKNLVGNPNVAFSVLDPQNAGRYLELRGAVRLEDDPSFTFLNTVANKYLGTDYPWSQPGDERVTVSLTPTRTSSMG